MTLDWYVVQQPCVCRGLSCLHTNHQVRGCPHFLPFLYKEVAPCTRQSLEQAGVFTTLLFCHCSRVAHGWGENQNILSSPSQASTAGSLQDLIVLGTLTAAFLQAWWCMCCISDWHHSSNGLRISCSHCRERSVAFHPTPMSANRNVESLPRQLPSFYQATELGQW